MEESYLKLNLKFRCSRKLNLGPKLLVGQIYIKHFEILLSSDLQSTNLVTSHWKQCAKKSPVQKKLQTEQEICKPYVVLCRFDSLWAVPNACYLWQGLDGLLVLATWYFCQGTCTARWLHNPRWPTDDMLSLQVQYLFKSRMSFLQYERFRWFSIIDQRAVHCAERIELSPGSCIAHDFIQLTQRLASCPFPWRFPSRWRLWSRWHPWSWEMLLCLILSPRREWLQRILSLSPQQPTRISFRHRLFYELIPLIEGELHTGKRLLGR